MLYALARSLCLATVAAMVLIVSSACGNTGANSGLVPPQAAGNAASTRPLEGAQRNSIAPAVIAIPLLTRGSRDLGVASASTPVAIAVTLAYHKAAELEQLVERQSDPSSSDYRRWLTSEQFAAEFGPTSAEYARVVQALRRAGFQVTQTFSNRTVIDARGTAATAQRYFATQIDRINQPGYGMRYANVRKAVVPAELRGLVYTVTGLNNLVFLHDDYTTFNTSTFHMPKKKNPGAGPPLYGPVSTAYGAAGYAPLAFSKAYDFPNQHKNSTGSYDGSGRTAGILMDADYRNADLASYLAYFKIKRTGKTIRVKVDGGSTSAPGLLNGDSVETTLDVETLAGNAPGATIYLYIFPPFGWGDYVVVDAFNAVVSQNKADTANNSWGGCEVSDPAMTSALDHIAMQGAALGITFHAATGDFGAGGSCPDLHGQSIPASSPHVVAVGGTALAISTNGAYMSEEGWNLSGGGVSEVFPEPAWQKGVANIFAGGRNLPDLSFQASDPIGTAFYYADTWNSPYDPLGGTSLASPLFGAALTEINQILGTRSGLAAKTLYALWKAKGYGKGASLLFHDVTIGDNNGFVCETGYDNVTGIGSMDVWNVAQALKK